LLARAQEGEKSVAEVSGTEGQPVEMDGDYACSLCGHRQHLEKDTPFPPDHHPDHPWTLMVADHLIPRSD